MQASALCNYFTQTPLFTTTSSKLWVCRLWWESAHWEIRLHHRHYQTPVSMRSLRRALPLQLLKAAKGKCSFSSSALSTVVCSVWPTQLWYWLFYRHKTGVQGRTFTFSAVFDAETSQQNFFEATAKLMVRTPESNKAISSNSAKDLIWIQCPLLQVTDILSGKKKACAMMAYGMSSAGKTHTMEVSHTLFCTGYRCSGPFSDTISCELPSLEICSPQLPPNVRPLQGSKGQAGVVPLAMQLLLTVSQ